MLLAGSVNQCLRGQQVLRGYILLLRGKVIEVNKCQTGYISTCYLPPNVAQAFGRTPF